MFSIKTFDGYDVEEPIDNVFIINDFISKEEINKIMLFIEGLTQADWEVEHFKHLKQFCLEKFGTDDVDQLVKEGKYEVTYNWHDKVISLLNDPEMYQIADSLTKKLFDILIKNGYDNWQPKGPGIIQRLYPGVPLIAHYDQYTDESIVYAAIIYVNDDYVDGELFFTHKNFKIKPKAGSMIIFPGTEEFHHGVIAPGEGPVRYCLPTFIGIQDFYNNKENN